MIKANAAKIEVLLGQTFVVPERFTSLIASNPDWALLNRGVDDAICVVLGGGGGAKQSLALDLTKPYDLHRSLIGHIGYIIEHVQQNTLKDFDANLVGTLIDGKLLANFSDYLSG